MFIRQPFQQAVVLLFDLYSPNTENLFRSRCCVSCHVAAVLKSECFACFPGAVMTFALRF